MASQGSSAGAPRARSPAWLRALRPEQWVKNVVVFAPLVFAMRLFDVPSVVYSLAAAVCFCAVSSAVYLINDVSDLERDRDHPRKRLRPLAAGEIAPGAALVVAALLGAGATLAPLAFAPGVSGAIGAYLALNVLYSIGLKRVALVDVIAIALGFVLRTLAGAEAIGVELSSWLEICAFMVMLFLALGKRRADLAVQTAPGGAGVPSSGWSVALLDQMLSVVVAVTIMSYCLYTLSPEVKERLGVERLEATVPFVVYGLLRYLWLVRESDVASDPTSAVLHDRPILITVALWALVVVAALYGHLR
jgi:4-hydroxybenzoate polyprenyltransferase